MADNTQEVNPEGSLTVAQFATAIRNKYPDAKLYKEKSDIDLTRAFIKSKPEYKIYEKRIKDLPPESFKVPSVGLGKKETITPKPPDVTDQQRKEMKDTAPSLKNLGKEMATNAAIGGGVLVGSLTLGAATEAFGTAASKVVPKIVEHIKQPGQVAKFPFGRALEYYLLTKLGFNKSKVAAIVKALE